MYASLGGASRSLLDGGAEIGALLNGEFSLCFTLLLCRLGSRSVKVTARRGGRHWSTAGGCREILLASLRYWLVLHVLWFVRECNRAYLTPAG